MRLDPKGYKFLVVASPREPLVHLTAALGDLAHAAPKKWSVLDAFIQDVLLYGPRSAWVQDRDYLDQYVRPSYLVLKNLLPRMAAVLSSQSEPLLVLSVADLVAGIMQDLRNGGASKAPVIQDPEYELYAAPDMQVAVRPEGIYAVFRLLAENAWFHGKATAVKLVVGATAAAPAQGELGPPQQLMLTLVDNGKGIDPEILEDLRQDDGAVARRKLAGGVHLGQGLLLCRAFALQNGGSLSVMEDISLETGTTNHHPRFEDANAGAWVTLKLPAVRDSSKARDSGQRR
jgi:signal transduction histidine kinase